MSLFGSPRRKRSKAALIRKLKNKLARRQRAAKEKRELESLRNALRKSY